MYEAINGPAPGKFLDTTHGTTHYVLERPEDAPLVVLQHGLGGTLALFDRVAADLVKQGCRVLRYEFYDRGYSQSDPERYPVTAVSHSLDFTLGVYVGQMRDVLTQLGLEEHYLIHCGHSTGGTTGIGYAAKYPERVRGLCLIDAVCLPAQNPLAARVADLPVLGNLLVRALGRRTMVKFSRGACHDPDGDAIRDFLERQTRNVRENQRFFAACPSTSSHCKGFVGLAEARFRVVCRAHIPLRLIWGKADTSVPYTRSAWPWGTSRAPRTRRCRRWHSTGCRTTSSSRTRSPRSARGRFAASSPRGRRRIE